MLPVRYSGHMGRVYILKLGGSVVTRKQGRHPVLRVRRIREIAREIANVRVKNPRLKCILLYGGGSFGHPLAHRYRLVGRSLSRRSLVGVGHTIAAMRELGTRISRILLDAGIPAVPLQTSSFMRVHHDRLRFCDFTIIETILAHGGVPLLGGDVAFSDCRRITIVSADRIAVELFRRFRRAKMLFATGTDGVYATYPPRTYGRPLSALDRRSIHKMLKLGSSSATSTDVTGAMWGKLRALLNARNTTALIFNGNARAVFSRVLSGRKEGTIVSL